MIADLLFQFLLAMAGTLGFAIIFKAPLKRLPACVFIGGCGWISYLIVEYCFDSQVFGCFIAACIVGLMSDIFARVLKDAATIFIIPGILCLVPGAKLFYTMEALLKGDFADTAQTGLQMLMMAGAIATGLLVMGAIIRVIRSIVNKTLTVKEKL